MASPSISTTIKFWLKALTAYFSGSSSYAIALDSLWKGHVRTWRKDATDGNAADTLAATYFYQAEDDEEVTEVVYVPGDALVAHDTNYATILLQKADGAGGAASTIASKTTKTAVSGGSGNWANGIPVPMALASTPVTLTDGQVLAFTITKAAAGVAVPLGNLVVHTKLV